jgi:hypothetical protein
MPVTWDDLEIRDASAEQFDALPGRQTGKRMSPQLVAILDAVEAGGIKEIRVPDESHSRGLRVALGRGAAQRGFKLDWRSDGSLLYVRRSDEPLKPRVAASAVPADGRKKRGRPPKNTTRDAELLEQGMSETME